MSADEKCKIYVLTYSLYGHVNTLAAEIKTGIEEAGCEAVMVRCPETLPADILEKMHAPPKDESIPEVDVKDLVNADGILFGFPTRFGTLPTQMKSVLDATGGLWQSGGLVGKPAGVFISTATQGGGQETSALTFLTQLAHHGMMFVPIGYSSPLLFNNDEVHGGSPYGAGTLAGGDGSRMPSDLEKGVAKHQGSFFAGTCKALKAGRAASA
ncbi:flagellar associated protein, quinone reductase-like protein [Ectocarpus siliculosus]|uniref:Flagellar associated protein, quinone reductase-like protein n=1 Tax=Ectocarpus siliculosus TaxID=2880 RepID=D8LTD7_ECTSI|nr:flagellar associated protein, quinone reductase-like protein [Ectocarpus siliculosus]|eukprot:CBN78047.1 flagellar associated protein, quinone reductase-like protein [Ectocarpus siliculosus]